MLAVALTLMEKYVKIYAYKSLYAITVSSDSKGVAAAP